MVERSLALAMVPWAAAAWLFVVSFGVVVLSFSGLHGIVFILGCRHLVLYVY